VLPTDERHDRTSATETDHPSSTWPTQLVKRVPQRALQFGRTRDSRACHAAAVEIGAELPLAAAVPVEEHRRRTLRRLGEQKHEPRHAPLHSDAMFVLGVRHVGHVRHAGAVAEPRDHHVDVATLDGFPAYRSWSLVTGHEVGHIGDRVARLQHRGFRRSHIRSALREPAELRSVAQEHPLRWPCSLIHSKDFLSLA
jgi:hypothetical protein